MSRNTKQIEVMFEEAFEQVKWILLKKNEEVDS